MMRFSLRKLLVLVVATVTGTGALAFSFIGVRWRQPSVTMHVGMSGTSPSGISWSTALVEAMNEWSEKTDFTFVANPAYADPCASGSSVNGIDFRSTTCGSSFGSSVLAVTLTGSEPTFFGLGETYHTSIVFNSAKSWDIYDGPVRSAIDFRRVALHELGHVLGLDHENSKVAMMYPSISNIHRLQPDDIDGANALYNNGNTGACIIRDLTANVSRSERLASGDCRVRDLFGGSDTSFIDVYRLTLAKTTTLDIAMSSGELDSVLILANAQLGDIEIYDDTSGSCDARVRKELPAGEYRILANTYVTPSKCVGNTGGYSLTISDSNMPMLGATRNVTGDTYIPNAVISGGASADGQNFATAYGANDAIDVNARIVPDPLHIGQTGQIYVLATLSDGRQFMRDSSGNFVRFYGGLANLVPTRIGTLAAVESVPVIAGFRGTTYGLAGQTLSIHVGYALASAPQDIWYGSSPIRFTLAPQ